MVIEFFGLPGVGKTYLAKKKASEKNIPYIEIVTRWERLWRSFFFFCTHPAISSVFIYEIIRETYKKPKLLKHKLLYLFFLTIAREQKAEKYKECVIDDGLFLFILSLYESVITDANLKKFKKVLNQTRFMIILVTADEDVRKKRLIARQRIPRHGFGEAYQNNWLSVMKKNSVIVRRFIEEYYVYEKALNNHI